MASHYIRGAQSLPTGEETLPSVTATHPVALYPILVVRSLSLLVRKLSLQSLPPTHLPCIHLRVFAYWGGNPPFSHYHSPTCPVSIFVSLPTGEETLPSVTTTHPLVPNYELLHRAHQQETRPTLQAHLLTVLHPGIELTLPLRTPTTFSISSRPTLTVLSTVLPRICPGQG